MSQNNKGYALVSMTNNDVYYTNQKTALLIRGLLKNGERLRFVTFVDTKSGASVSVSLDNISSIVVKEGYGV